MKIRRHIGSKSSTPFLTPILVSVTLFVLLCIVLFGFCYYKRKKENRKMKECPQDSDNSDTIYEIPYEDETDGASIDDTTYDEYND